MLHLVAGSNSGNGIFQQCDSNADNKLTLKELKTCLSNGNVDASVIGRTDPESIMKLMDINNDNELSFAEFMKVVNNVKKSKNGKVDVIDKEGNKKTYSSEELFERVNEIPNGLKMEGDKLLKESEGKMSLDKIQQENPQLGNIINLGNWSLHTLIYNHIVNNSTVIRHLNTLPKNEERGSDNTISLANIFEVGSCDVFVII